MYNNFIYKHHKLGFYFYSVKYYYEDTRKNSKIKALYNAIKHCRKIFNDKELWYEYLEIPITTTCNLKCKNCSNLIPCYKHPKDYDIKILTNSIKEFLKCYNNIICIRVLGGEPFLSKNLYEVIELLLKSKKIQRIEIVTNGLIIPRNKKIINLLKNPHIIISISKYPNININNLIRFLKENSIKYKIIKRKYWFNYGNAKKRNKSEKELTKQFKKCNNICKSMINGKIHFCPRSSHGTDLGIIKGNNDDYIDLLDSKMSTEEKRKKIYNLSKKKYIKACDYCDFATPKCKKIAVAEQNNNIRKRDEI